MRKALIHRFFKELGRELGKPAEMIVTGAAAGTLLGTHRPSLDIDFEIRVKSGSKTSSPSETGEAVQRASEKTGVSVNFSENINRWSMIDLLDYRRTAIPYRKIGQLQIKVMAPEYWTIGKMGRYYEVDIRDVLRMIQRKKLKPSPLLSLWARALRSSPLSLDSGQFRDHVIDFLKSYGKSAWGKRFNAEQGIALFKRAAHIE